MKNWHFWSNMLFWRIITKQSILLLSNRFRNSEIRISISYLPWPDSQPYCKRSFSHLEEFLLEISRPAYFLKALFITILLSIGLCVYACYVAKPLNTHTHKSLIGNRNSKIYQWLYSTIHGYNCNKLTSGKKNRYFMVGNRSVHIKEWKRL